MHKNHILRFHSKTYNWLDIKNCRPHPSHKIAIPRSPIRELQSQLPRNGIHFFPTTRSRKRPIMRASFRPEQLSRARNFLCVMTFLRQRKQTENECWDMSSAIPCIWRYYLRCTYIRRGIVEISIANAAVRNVSSPCEWDSLEDNALRIVCPIILCLDPWSRLSLKQDSSSRSRPNTFVLFIYPKMLLLFMRMARRTLNYNSRMVLLYFISKVVLRVSD